MKHKLLLIIGLLCGLKAIGADSKSIPAPEPSILTHTETLRQLEEVRKTPGAIPALSLAYLDPHVTPEERHVIHAKIIQLETAQRCALEATRISINPDQARSNLIAIYNQTKSPFAAGLLLDPRLTPHTPEQTKVITSSAAALRAGSGRPRSETEPTPCSAAPSDKVAQIGRRCSRS